MFTDLSALYIHRQSHICGSTWFTICSIIKTSLAMEWPPLSLISKCFEFLRCYLQFEPFIVWKRLQEHGLYMIEGCAFIFPNRSNYFCNIANTPLALLHHYRPFWGVYLTSFGFAYSRHFHPTDRKFSFDTSTWSSF